jgi:NAD+ diphosphatase
MRSSNPCPVFHEAKQLARIPGANPQEPQKLTVLVNIQLRYRFSNDFRRFTLLQKTLFPTSLHMVFTASLLDRASQRRTDAAWLTSLRVEPSSRCVVLHDDKVALTEDGALHFAASIPLDAILLGIDPQGCGWFAAVGLHEGRTMDLRGLAASGVLPKHELDLLAQARSLLHWHARHGFCAHCGAATLMSDAGYKRSCPSCQAEHFPRTDPVIIIAVQHEGRVLLGRQASWPQGMYSTLAGFMEPGETIEDAARREVKEESGIIVGRIEIVANQPWPFPSSLMIGLIGEALSTEIAIDVHEIEDARWFTPEDIRAMKAGTHPAGLKIPPPLAIAHHLIARSVED